MTNNLDEFNRKLAAAKKTREDSPENMKRSAEDIDREMSFGMKVGIEMFACVLVGGIIGYTIDMVANTMPLFLIIFIMVGSAAGIWTIFKTVLKDNNKDS